MKTGKIRQQLLFLACGLVLLLLNACSKEHGETTTYKILSPVYEDRSTVLAALNGRADQSFLHTGKIYVKDNFIFINEIDKGIHVIDNTNPSHPRQIAFLRIPGNEDIAILGNILYADMYADLLAIDVTDVTKAHLTASLNNFFTGRQYVNGYYTSGDQVITDWVEKDTTAPVNPPMNCLACEFMLANAAAGPVGQAGSMAKMVLLNNYLYAISEAHSLGIASVTNAKSPHFEGTMFAGYDLETIYPFEDMLFLGSDVGMFMYDVSNPVQPQSLGTFEHGRACDPVVTDGSYAYVTLHAGTHCGGDQNELDVVDVRNIEQSVLVKTYPMTKPTGLCQDGNLLFVCDSTVVKIFDTTDPSALQLLNQVSCNSPYDVIARNKIAMVVNNEGLFQYDYTDLNNIKQLSFLSEK